MGSGIRGRALGDTPLLARYYAPMRSLRIADGPYEVHLMAIARHELGQ